MSNPVVAALLGTCVALVGAVIGWYLIDKIGRRPLLIIPMFATGICLTLVALGTVLNLPAAVTVVCFFGYLLFYGSMSILCGVYPLEVFPTPVRTSGLGLASGFSRIGAALATFLTPIGFAQLGLGPVLIVFAGVCFLGGVVSLVMAPETARKSLTETGAAHVENARGLPEAERESVAQH
ncbi:MFS transporter [Rathayibacter sp. CAU 1779]